MTTWRLCSHVPPPPPPASFSDPCSFPFPFTYLPSSPDPRVESLLSQVNQVYTCCCLLISLAYRHDFNELTNGRICRFSYLVWNCNLLGFQLLIFSTYITEKKFFRLPWKPACMIVTTFLVVEVWLLPLSDFLITNKNFPCLSSVNPWKLNKNK